jgi:hypothetical protein
MNYYRVPQKTIVELIGAEVSAGLPCRAPLQASGIAQVTCSLASATIINYDYLSCNVLHDKRDLIKA